MSQPSTARPWSPEWKHSDRERWICIYPAYINSKKTIAEGRKLAKANCVDNPTYTEIRDILSAAGVNIGVENKVYVRERDPKDLKYRGRIRMHLKDDDGQPLTEQFPDRRSVLLYLGETIPKLKTRQQSGGQTSGLQPSTATAAAAGAGKKTKKNKKR